MKEQCTVNLSDHSNPLEMKRPQEIPSDSFQNPSDPDATYSGHKGQGYQVQVMETYCSEKSDVVSCPQSHVPVRTKKTRHIVAFDSHQCSNCPLQETCLVKQAKKYHYLRYTDKEMRLARRRAYEQTEEFKDRYRWRAGSEATMSEYDRKTGVKHLRVRGFKAVRFCATLIRLRRIKSHRSEHL